jgi:transposase
MRRIGIDPSLKGSHRVAVFDDGTAIGKPFPMERTREGVEKMIRRATEGSSGPCEFIMEPTGLAWVVLAAEIVRRGHRAFVPKPRKTAALRKVLSPHAKTDGRDAIAGALIRQVDQDGVHELRLPSAEAMTLRLFVTHRARLSAQVARSKARLHGWLVLANPHLTEILGDDGLTQVVTAFMRQHLDPFEVRAAGRDQLERFWERHSWGGRINRDKLDAVWDACNTTCDLYEALRAEAKLPFLYASLQELIRHELEQIEFLEGTIRSLEKTIADLYGKLDPERVLERQIPGVGPTIAPAIEALVGDVTRFANVKRFASFFGFVPKTHQTGVAGEKSGQRLSKGGPNLLKRFLFLAAETARREDPQLAATYQLALERGKHHRSAVVIVAHKLVRRIYAILTARAAARPVQYALVDLEGKPISSADARHLVRQRFPAKTKRTSARRRASAASSQKAGTMAGETGSSEDATKGDRAAPPIPHLPDSAAQRRAVENLVENILRSQGNITLDSP